MKNKYWNKFKTSYTRLILLILISLLSGLSMLIQPEHTSLLVIRGVGLVWTLEGIGYVLDLHLKYLKNK